RMYEKQESVFYYLTVMNEPYPMPALPEGAREGILKGLYLFKAASNEKSKLKSKLCAQILGSGAILLEAVKEPYLPEEKSDVAADVWSVTSYKELYRDGHAADR